MGLRSTLLTGLIPVCLSAATVHAQESLRSRGAAALPKGPGRISGKVITSANGQPLGRAVITVRSATDSMCVKGGTATPDGSFQVEELPLGDYRVRINHVGYRPAALDSLTLSAARSAVDAGTVKLDVAP